MTFDPAALIEPLAVVTGIAGVALTVGQRVSSWPIGIISTALFLALFIQAGLYADAGLQVLYIVLGVYGWWAWLHGGDGGATLPVSVMTGRARLLAVVAVVPTIALLGWFLDGATDSTLPYPDAATTVLSIAAQILLTRKKLESWPLWILGVNLPYIAIYLVKGLTLTAALQLVFIALSVAGWAAWRRACRSAADAGLGPTGGRAITAQEVAA